MLETILKGGWVMLPLFLCSLVSVAVIIERVLFFRHASATDKADEVLLLLHSGQTKEAIELVKKGNAPILTVLARGLAHRYSPDKAMEAEGLLVIAKMKRGLPILDTIITLSPLLGLLGTIIGMMGSFQIMATSGGMGQPHAVTGGVAEALIATATGITVAVITLIPYNYFLARIEWETERIEHYATELELVFAKQASRGEKHEDAKKYA